MSIPGTCADRLTPYTPKDRVEIHEVLREQVYDALNDVADGKTISAEVTGRNLGRRPTADRRVPDTEEEIA